MKAAVLYQFGAVPHYEDFPDPVAGDGEVVVEVKAVAVENVDKAVAVSSLAPVAWARAAWNCHRSLPMASGSRR
jgi:NADPH:quinone reductase-like Zn-dependent oxidoreductase